MFRLFSRRTTAAVVRRSTLLRLESLEWRDQPSDLTGSDLTPPPLLSATAEPPVNNPPLIVDFGCEEISPGLFVFSGTVIDEDPAGLTVTFTGDIPTLNGRTVLVDEDGTFTFVIQLNTDGSDAGH